MALPDDPQSVYAKNLGQQFGYPLRSPGPDPGLPDSYQEIGFHIGDVGNVDQWGVFQVEFNVCFGQDHELHQDNSGLDGLIDLISYERNDITSNPNACSPNKVFGHVNCSTHGDSKKYTARSTSGAILILPSGAASKYLKTRRENSFRTLAETYGEGWCEYAGCDSVYLITGFHKSTRWHLASFDDLEPLERDIVSYNESAIPRCDWMSVCDSHDSPLENIRENQAVFISGFMIKLGNQGVQARRYPQYQATNVRNRSEVVSNTSISRIPKLVKPYHPSSTINDYKMQKNTNARIVITHDNEWIHMLKENKISYANMTDEKCFLAFLEENYTVDQNSNVSCRGIHLEDAPESLPDLTDRLEEKLVISLGYFSIIYRCRLRRQGTNSEDTSELPEHVVVKAIVLQEDIQVDQKVKDEFERKIRRERGVWRRLKHPNIVPLLGTASGEEFGSVYKCLVSPFVVNKTLFDYIKQHATTLSISNRVALIRESTAGLEYLHSKDVIHGDFHPGNILIDEHHKPCLTDFGLFQTFSSVSEQLAYLHTKSTRSGVILWAAPELVCPQLYPELEVLATLHADIYSLGSVTLFILSDQFPWKSREEAENGLWEFRNPSRPAWPIVIPDGAWNFIERCWSPKYPKSRPTARDVLSFCTDKLEGLLLPNPANVVLFGDIGSGKSSIINLLSGKLVVPISTDQMPRAEPHRSYPISINQVQFQLWDTTGFALQRGRFGVDLLPYERAHAILRNLPDPANLILLCADKDTISPSLGHLYWFINHFFYDGHAQIALVVTNFDTDISTEEWWESEKEDIAKRTGIPVDSIPHVCISGDPTVGGQSGKIVLEGLLQKHAAVIPVPIRPDFCSYKSASTELFDHCGLQDIGAKILVEKLRPFNIIFFGESGAEMISMIDLITGDPKANVRTGTVTMNSRLCRITLLDTMGANDGHEAMKVLEDACQLIHSLPGEGAGVDLLVFCKRFGDSLSKKEMSGYRLFKDMLCKGKPPVAVVITQFKSQHPPERWWKTEGKKLLESLGGDPIPGPCIRPFATHDDAKGSQQVAEQSRSIQTMMESCVQYSRASSNDISSMGKMMLTTKHMVVQVLEDIRANYGLTFQQTEKIKQHFFYLSLNGSY